MRKTFVRGKEKYSVAEKKELGELLEKYKKEYDTEVRALQRKNHDYKRKKHVPIKPKQGFLATAFRELYSDLADVKHDDDNLRKALKFAKRCHEKYLNDEFVNEEPSKKRFPKSGGGRKCKALEVREPMLEWFINLRGVLKGCFPIKIFRSKYQQVYDEWLKQQPEPVPEQDQLKFSKHWI